MTMRVVSVKMPQDLIDKIDNVAKDQHRDRSGTVRFLIHRGLENLQAGSADDPPSRLAPRSKQ